MAIPLTGGGGPPPLPRAPQRGTGHALTSRSPADPRRSADIVWDETLGPEGRAGYYDHAGALRDMIQNHLLQLLAFVATEPPTTLDERDLRDRKNDVLRAVAVPDDMASATSRARYTAGHVGEKDLPAYANEDGVDPCASPSNPTRSPWTSTSTAPATPSTSNAPRSPPPSRANSSPYSLPPREIMQGDPTLSIRGDEAEESWRVVEPILRAWADDQVPLAEYPAG